MVLTLVGLSPESHILENQLGGLQFIVFFKCIILKIFLDALKLKRQHLEAAILLEQYADVRLHLLIKTN